MEDSTNGTPTNIIDQFKFGNLIDQVEIEDLTPGANDGESNKTDVVDKEEKETSSEEGEATSKVKEDTQDVDDSEPDENSEDNADNTDEPADDSEPYETLAFEISKYAGFDVELEDIQAVMEENSMDGFMNFIQTIVNESKPDYADPIIAQLNDYVANGGNLRTFFENNFAETSYKDVELEDLSLEDKKSLITEYQKKTTKLSESKVKKLVEKLEEDEIDEVAEDALEALKSDEQKRLKDFEQSQKQKLEERRRQQEEAYEKREDYLKSSIKNAGEIAGFPINKTQKERFEKFMFEKTETVPEINTATGKPTGKQVKVTPYQKTIASNQNLELELAYLMFLGGNKSSIAKYVENDTAKKLKQGFNKQTSGGAKNTSIVDPPKLDNPKDKKDPKKIAKNFSLNSLA